MPFTPEPAEPRSAGIIETDVGTLEERRLDGRTLTDVAAKLADFSSQDVISCTAKDICEGGVYVHAPESSGITVGQRYEITLTDQGDAKELVDFPSEGCYATVIRTERVADAPPDTIGAGLRFDQPLIL